MLYFDIPYMNEMINPQARIHWCLLLMLPLLQLDFNGTAFPHLSLFSFPSFSSPPVQV